MRWPAYTHVFFDCDSTLTAVEGIDILAETAGKAWRIEVLTKAAMDGDLDLAEVYGKRLRAVRPTRAQVLAVRHFYRKMVVEDAAAVIAALQALGHQVYIISGGLARPVVEFGLFLGVPRDQIRAVDLEFNRLSGNWWRQSDSWAERYLDYDDGSLTVSDGKADIVRDLLQGREGRSLLVGDGVSDLLASRAVDLFAGYGGVVTRPRVLAEAPAFVHTRSLAPLLVLAAGPAALRRLRGTSHEAVFTRGLRWIAEGAISFQDEQLKTKFHQAYQALYSRPD